MYIDRSGRQSYYDFAPGATGDIKIMATTGEGALPVSGAYVTVDALDRGRLYRIDEGVTGKDGIVIFSGLPAKLKARSQAPDKAYAGEIYRVEISHPLLGRQINDIAVFAETVSVWQVTPEADGYERE